MSSRYSLLRRARWAGAGRRAARRRSHCAAAVAYLAAGMLLVGGGVFSASTTAFAAEQQTVGSIYGATQPAPNQTVRVTNTGTGLTRTAKVAGDGTFQIPALPAGSYLVELLQSGQVIATQKDVAVTAGSGTAVNFAQQQATKLSTITVAGNSIAPIDVSSTHTTMNVTATEVNRIPVQKNILSVALLAPTVNANPAFTMPSFGGASSAENAFYVNGFNVTDDLDFLHLAQPPFEALANFQIKTGGIGAAYGNALGGVINMETKAGSNTFHAGFDINWQPRPLQNLTGQNTVIRNAQGLPTTLLFQDKSTKQMQLRYNVWASGPIIKNHLFFYGMVQETRASLDTYNAVTIPTPFSGRGDVTQLGTSESMTQKTPYALGRIDWDINSNNVLTVTGWKTTGTTDGTEYNLIPNSDGLLTSTQRGSTVGHYQLQSGSKALIGKYTWYATSNFNISAMYGYLRFNRGSDSNPSDCPRAFDNRSGVLTQIGCWVGYVSIVSPNASDARHEYRIDAQWLSGSGAGLLSGHDVTFGYDYQGFRSDGIRHYPGPTVNGVPGIEWVYNSVPATGVVNGVCYPGGGPIPGTGVCPGAPGTTASGNWPGQYYVSGRQFLDKGSFLTEDRAYYIEDNWHITPRWYLNLGIRNDNFKNYNGQNQVYIDQTNNWGPRLGFSWDVNGNSTLKMFGSYAEYFIPVANNTSVRAAGGEYDVYGQDYVYGSIDPTTGAPVGLGQKLGPSHIQGSGIAPNPLLPAAVNLKPMSQKEIILGFQKAINQNWTYSVRVMRRWLVNGSDDECTFLSIPGYSPDVYAYIQQHYGTAVANASLNTGVLAGQYGGTSCIIANPGNDVQTYGVNANGQLIPITISNSFIKMPRAQRTYNAIELQLTRSFSDKWMFSASYTWSHLYGNEEGYVLTPIAQTDAGITEAFDFPALETGAYGNLSNDHRHVFKLFGAYQFAPDWRIGANALIMSGKPLSCLGTYPSSTNFAYFYGSFTHYCGADGVNPNSGTLVQQGTFGTTEWVYYLNLQLAWTPSQVPGMTVYANWYNVLGTNHVTQRAQAYDNGNYVPIPTFMTPTAYQDPMSFEVGLRYRFL